MREPCILYIKLKINEHACYLSHITVFRQCLDKRNSPEILSRILFHMINANSFLHFSKVSQNLNNNLMEWERNWLIKSVADTGNVETILFVKC